MLEAAGKVWAGARYDFYFGWSERLIECLHNCIPAWKIYLLVSPPAESSQKQVTLSTTAVAIS